MREQIRISKVSEKDISQLQAIGRQTFSETFEMHNSPENMREYLKNSFSVEKLSDEICNPDSEFYFAWAGEKLAGYLKVNFGNAQTELKDDKAVEIERIYALKEFHGSGVGQSLYNKALEIARQRKAAYIWLGVWEKNPRAVAFYRKNGFAAFGEHIFKLGDDEQTDLLMRMDL